MHLYIKLSLHSFHEHWAVTSLAPMPVVCITAMTKPAHRYGSQRPFYRKTLLKMPTKRQRRHGCGPTPAVITVMKTLWRRPSMYWSPSSNQQQRGIVIDSFALLLHVPLVVIASSRLGATGQAVATMAVEATQAALAMKNSSMDLMAALWAHCFTWLLKTTATGASLCPRSCAMTPAVDHWECLA